VSILVNNAGLQRRRAFVEFLDEDWDAIMATNLTGPYRVSKAVLPAMIERRRGKIIHIASLMSELARPDGRAVHGIQGRHPAAHARHGGRARAAQRAGQRDRAGLLRDRDEPCAAGQRGSSMPG
jgi:NAD(P)-dependent dehydrogenase (short-subunit alcohol dehydrogenase family)